MKYNEPGTLRKVTPEADHKKISRRESFGEFVEEMRESSSRSEWKESVTFHSSDGELMSQQEYTAKEIRKGCVTDQSASSSAVHSCSQQHLKSCASEKSSASKQAFVSHSTLHLKLAGNEKHDEKEATSSTDHSSKSQVL